MRTHIYYHVLEAHNDGLVLRHDGSDQADAEMLEVQ